MSNPSKKIRFFLSPSHFGVLCNEIADCLVKSYTLKNHLSLLLFRSLISLRNSKKTSYENTNKFCLDQGKVKGDLVHL